MMLQLEATMLVVTSQRCTSRPFESFFHLFPGLLQTPLEDFLVLKELLLELLSRRGLIEGPTVDDLTLDLQDCL